MFEFLKNLFKKRIEPDIHCFHGGCNGCTQQLVQSSGVDFCVKCQFFNADWNLPNLNNKPPTSSDIVKARLINKYGLKV